MQREIKFRVWYEKSKEYKYPTDSIFPRDCYIDDLRAHQNRNIIIQQYTGLKDKNSKEIYEGDIIHYYNDDSYTITDEVLVCKYSPNNAWFTFNENSDEEDNGYYWLEIRNLCEIIGNIFENPDLIK